MAVVVAGGAGWATDDTSAVAIWVPPGSGDMGLGRILRIGLARMPFTGMVRRPSELSAP